MICVCMRVRTRVHVRDALLLWVDDASMVSVTILWGVHSWPAAGRRQRRVRCIRTERSIVTRTCSLELDRLGRVPSQPRRQILPYGTLRYSNMPAGGNERDGGRSTSSLFAPRASRLCCNIRRTRFHAERKSTRGQNCRDLGVHGSGIKANAVTEVGSARDRAVPREREREGDEGKQAGASGPVQRERKFMD